MASDLLVELVAAMDGVWLNSDNLREAYVSRGRSVTRLRQRGDTWNTPPESADFVNILRDDVVHGRIQWGGKGRFVLEVRDWKGTEANVVHWGDPFGGPRGWNWHRAPIDIAATIEALVATPSFKEQQEQQQQYRQQQQYFNNCSGFGGSSSSSYSYNSFGSSSRPIPAPGPPPIPPKTVTSGSPADAAETPHVVLPPKFSSGVGGGAGGGGGGGAVRTTAKEQERLLEESLKNSLNKESNAAVSKSRGGPPPHRTNPQNFPPTPPSTLNVRELMEYQRRLQEQQEQIQQQIYQAQYAMGAAAPGYDAYGYAYGYGYGGGGASYGTSSGFGAYRARPY
mmetsp:Transcript_38485/g.81624  ORF Transcript_38485/g.81624 Transcript_38485/m.81624 type:complete len:338 (-) Transcript_38485:226-1239(-)